MGPASGRAGKWGGVGGGGATGGGGSHKQALLLLLCHLQMESHIQAQRCHARVELSCTPYNIAGKM